MARLTPLPLLVGISRKGFMGVPVAERDALSQFASLAAVQKGAAVIRTHAVGMAAQFVDAAQRMQLPLPAASVYR